MDTLATVRDGQLTSAPIIDASYYQRFINYVDASEKTLQTYTRALKQFALYLTEINNFRPTREDLIRYKEHLSSKGLKPTTISCYIVAVRLFFQWTNQERLYPNIAEHLKGSKISRDHKRDYLTSSQAKKLINSIDRSTLRGKRDYAIILLMLTGGLRTIEIVRANVEDLRALGDNQVLYLQGKGREERTDFVILPVETDTAVREYLSARGEARPGEALFTSTSHNNSNGRITTRSVSGIAKDLLRTVGYDSDRLTAHSLRHSAITLALLGGNTLAEASQFARHSDISTTMIYNHALDVQSNTCSRTIASSLFYTIQ